MKTKEMARANTQTALYKYSENQSIWYPFVCAPLPRFHATCQLLARRRARPDSKFDPKHATRGNLLAQGSGEMRTPRAHLSLGQPDLFLRPVVLSLALLLSCTQERKTRR